MASRGTALSRALAFFREGNIDEVRVAFTLAKEIVDARLDRLAQTTQQKLPLAPPRTRKRRTTTTQAQAEAAAGNGAETLADA